MNELGEFDFGAAPFDIGEVEFREEVTEENGARYEGFWL